MCGKQVPSPNQSTLDNDINSDTLIEMTKIDDILKQMQQNPKDVRFSELCKIWDHYFGEARQKKSSHRIYRTPWQGNPGINIQNDKGKAKAYQVKQVLLALEMLEVNYGTKSTKE
ncbi:MAG: toxin HicA [Thermodesulfobacteriota bacterium]